MSHHMTSDEFRRHGHAVVDWIADYLDRVGDLPVQSPLEPGWVRGQLPMVAPEAGEPFEAVLADVERIILPGITHWNSPRFHAYFPANNSGPSILGELLSAGLGVQGMLWATSPACTELETHVLDWMAGLLGLPDRFRSTATGGGVIQDSASSAALVAIVTARDRAQRQGHDPGDMVVYVSTQAHSSLEKGARVAAIGHLRQVDVDGDHAMRPQALSDAIDADLAHGLVPIFVNATVGTTSSHAVDPVGPIAAVAAPHGLWVHVDAAHLGMAALCPEHRSLLAGVEAVDSVNTNAHKWLFTNFDCSLMWFADRRPLLAALSILPEYLRNEASATGHVIDYRDWQIPLGRRFRALKLWFVLRHYGAEGLRHHIREHIRLTAQLAERFGADPRFEVVAPARASLLCVAHVDGDDATNRLLGELNASGRTFLSHTVLDGRYVIRISIGSTLTEARHVDDLWTLFDNLAPAPA